nr:MULTISPECIES: 2-C-methyl-D-erythritol 2,4-cyclodiphosphate synthase [unclassified Fusibacter]
MILGGVTIPYEKGLLGHSDADVLIHAIMDAILGAAALGDIGLHFPDIDEAYKGASSMTLLKRVNELIREKGFIVNNVDATVVCEQPKLKPYIAEMVKNISMTLDLAHDAVNVKATTTEGLGFEGEGKGISAQAVASLRF